MRKLLSKAFIFIGVLSLVLGTLNTAGQSIAYAEDLELRGTDLGLEIIPTARKLFDLQNLNPGDSKEGKITIKNNYGAPFNLFMRAERMSDPPSPGDVDLFGKLKLKVYLGEVLKYDGQMINFATTNIDLGDFASNSEKELKATINLPGPETGNEFQGKSVEVKWIFIATSEGTTPPEQPTGGGGGGGGTVIITPITPTTPTTPTVPETPEEVVDEEIPEAQPELPEEEEVVDEEIPQDKPEKPEEEAVVDEEVPEGKPIMPKTGQIPATIYYAIGTLLVGLGLGFRKKDEE